MEPNNSRRIFIRNLSVSGGGLVLGIGYIQSGFAQPASITEGSSKENFIPLNGYIKIDSSGKIKLMSPNPEAGQNIKTAMPMILAEELDVDWDQVIVEQAPLDTAAFSFQFIGGSQGIRRGWRGLRLAGATAKKMLIEAAADTWNVAPDEIVTASGILSHKYSEKKATYGEMADKAAKRIPPQQVELKPIDKFKIVGYSQKNVDIEKIITGKPLFGIDMQPPGTLTAMIVHPPAFGLKITSIRNRAEVLQMPGIKDVFLIEVYEDTFEKKFFDTLSFNKVAVVVGRSTWEVMQAKKILAVECELRESHTETRDRFGRKWIENTPSGLENTETHYAQMEDYSKTKSSIRRKDGDPDKAFAQAAQIVERTYTAPFLAHNCMEPMNFFADVKENSAQLAGPLQKPEYTEQTVSERLQIPVENIDIQLTRLGGGYGRRSYAHWLVEAALISKKSKAPIKLIYTREDDLTGGIYRPTYQIKYRAGLDNFGNLIALNVNAGGIPQSPLAENRFPAGAVENYLAESWTIDSNITVGSFRAPSSNFMASAEQSFLDELAEIMKKDPIAFRLELLQKAMNSPIGENNDYDPKRYAGVLELVKTKSNWGKTPKSIHRGVSAYYCHNSYVAQVLDIEIKEGKPVIQKVTCAIDCGLVINPDSAKNMAEGGIIDAIGNALYGELTFAEGVPSKSNFNTYQMARMKDAPEKIDVHFVQNGFDPTGLGEPTFPPTFGALANALYQAKGKRLYKQPYSLA